MTHKYIVLLVFWWQINDITVCMVCTCIEKNDTGNPTVFFERFFYLSIIKSITHICIIKVTFIQNAVSFLISLSSISLCKIAPGIGFSFNDNLAISTYNSY